MLIIKKKIAKQKIQRLRKLQDEVMLDKSEIRSRKTKLVKQSDRLRKGGIKLHKNMNYINKLDAKWVSPFILYQQIVMELHT